MPTTGHKGSLTDKESGVRGVRLQKFLSAAGYCSRRRGERFISEGKVTVNGRTVTRLGTKVDPGMDTIAVCGKTIVPPVDDAVYIALHKPRGVVTSCEQKGARVVTDLVEISRRIYPVGRLDKDSSGLLLLTNDGELHNRLSHPSFDHEKEYIVSTDRPLSEVHLKRLADGVFIQGRKTRPAVVHRLAGRRFGIILKEGRNRQIRRMVEKIGLRVVKLKRVRIAGLLLGDLPSGQWRHLTRREARSLRETVSAPRKALGK